MNCSGEPLQLLENKFDVVSSFRNKKNLHREDIILKIITNI